MSFECRMSYPLIWIWRERKKRSATFKRLFLRKWYMCGSTTSQNRLRISPEMQDFVSSTHKNFQIYWTHIFYTLPSRKVTNPRVQKKSILPLTPRQKYFFHSYLLPLDSSSNSVASSRNKCLLASHPARGLAQPKSPK